MNLYRRSTLQASLVLLLAGIVGFTTVVAQRHKPHKLRATALLEFVREPSGVTAPRLVPITILDDGSFHDASIYKAAPQPMALDSGVVYEALKSGQIMGYFTVDKAKKKDDLWTAQGWWQLLTTTPKARASAASSSTPVRSPDERPIIRRPGSAQSPTATASPTPAPSSSSSPTPTTTTPSSSSPSDDRPVLHRPAGDAAPSPSTPAATPSPSTTASAPEPEPDDPNRPTLRRRAPQSAQPAETTSIPTSSIPSRSGEDVATSKSAAPASSGPSAALQTLVAVSDAQTSDSRSYEFVWKPGEQEAVEAKMRRLALVQLPRDNGNAPLTEKSLSNVVIRGFDLDLSNDAVMVLSAEVPPAPASSPVSSPATKAATKSKAGAKSSSPSSPAPAPSSRATRYLTLIARVDIDGNPQKLASSVTDSSRLDVAPRLELIDAVDVDGDGLAELLFRDYSFDDKSFVIFAIGRSTVTKLFEGASQPLK
jgi:hypothetical protein